MKKIAIFASGRGSNARRLVEHFKGHTAANITLIVSNKPDAPVLDMAREQGIATLIFNKKKFYNKKSVIPELTSAGIDFIVLAGFLWLMPKTIVEHYPKRIINLHPALLPKYGGKGMYGMKVHQAVRAANETETGITIHYVNEQYDEGNIIFQARCTVEKNDTPEDIAQKIHELEHKYLPIITEKLVVSSELASDE